MITDIDSLSPACLSSLPRNWSLECGRGVQGGNVNLQVGAGQNSSRVNSKGGPIITYMYKCIYVCDHLCFHAQNAAYISHRRALPITVAFDYELGRARHDSSCTAGKWICWIWLVLLLSWIPGARTLYQLTRNFLSVTLRGRINSAATCRRFMLYKESTSYLSAKPRAYQYHILHSGDIN